MKGYCGLGSEVIFPFVAKIRMKSIHLDVLLLENQTQEISYHEFPRTFKKIDNYPSGTLWYLLLAPCTGQPSSDNVINMAVGARNPRPSRLSHWVGHSPQQTLFYLFFFF